MAGSGGRERPAKPTQGRSDELAAPKWGGEVSTKRRRGAGEQDPRERTGGADKRERQPAPAPDQPPRETPRHPARPGPPGSPRQPAGVTDADRRGPQSERRRAGSPAREVAPHPQGSRPGGGAGAGRGEPRLFSAPSRLPALNGSVIDWPRVLFSPRAAGARGRLISIFPAAAPRCGSCCSRPPRRPPRIYLWFQEEVGAESGIRACRVKSTQKKFFERRRGGWGETFVNAGSNLHSLGLIVGRRREEQEAETGGEGKR